MRLFLAVKIGYIEASGQTVTNHIQETAGSLAGLKQWRLLVSNERGDWKGKARAADGRLRTSV